MSSTSTASVSIALLGLCALRCAFAAPDFEAHTISTRPETVSDGDVLVQMSAPARSRWTAQLNGRDVSHVFQPTKSPGGPIALLTGLAPGSNTLEIRVNGKISSTLRILNHPIVGPIFSGPHQEPFICQTDVNGLGPALDADCSAKTVVQYYYKSTKPAEDSPLGPGLKTYDPNGPTPLDVAQTVTSQGHTVNYIVRREIGTINRAVYEIQFLHQPGQPLPTPWAQQNPSWNGRLIYSFGAGCASGYRQGTLNPRLGPDPQLFLELGYAFATSTLNIFTNNCNDRLSAETMSMVKEYFIEHFGKPVHTIGMGGSGGAMQLQLIAQNDPSMLDGILMGASFPDVLTWVPAATDCMLLRHAFDTSTLRWTEEQKTAVSGFATWRTCTKMSVLDPTNCDRSIPKEMIYDRTSNPRGVRCDLYSNYINALGRDSRTGFARRPLDNAGIQYGLVAFNNRQIDAEQFVQLNERAGGFDEDGNVVGVRTVADPQVLSTAYQRGLVLTGGGGLSQIPIIDSHVYTDDQGDEHYRLRAIQTRSRLMAANGNADNHVMFLGPPVFTAALSNPENPNSLELAQRAREHLRLMDRWLDSIAADTAAGTRSQKAARNRPAELSDSCQQVDGKIVFERATFDGSGICNRTYPPHRDPRLAAGAPLSGDVLKCALKPIKPEDYAQPLSEGQLKRLKAIFSTGVCDFSKPGVGQETYGRIVPEAHSNPFPGEGRLGGADKFSNAAPHGNTPTSVAERLVDPRPIVAAHRACFQDAPENSLKAIKACITHGVDAVEGDLRTTKDGVIVLFHDSTLDRMTNASGPLKSYTYAELRNIRLRQGAGGKDAPLTDERIPTFAQALKAGQGRSLFILEMKEANYDQAFDVVVAQRVEDQVIFYLDAVADSAELHNARFLGRVAYIPMVWQCGVYDRHKDCYEVLSEAVADYQQFNPVAYMATFSHPEFLDVRGEATVTSGGNDAATWARVIGSRSRFFFTDRPVEMMEYLKSRGLR